MKFSAALVSVALAALAAAQANNTELGVEAIEAHFSNAGIVPTLLSSFDPVAVMSLSYTGVGDISPGQQLTKDQVAPTPNLAVTPANSTVQLSGNYTLAMVDAGPVGTDESAGQTRHWLVNGVTLTGSSPMNVSTDDGLAVTDYAGPAPPQGSGAHRYVILLFTQPDNFTAPDGFDTANIGVSVFNLTDYVKSSNLGPIVAGTYITVEEGAATFTPSSTAPVETSTLPAAHSTSASSTAPPSPSGSGSTQNNAGSALVPLSSAIFAAFFGLGFILL